MASAGLDKGGKGLEMWVSLLLPKDLRMLFIGGV